MARSLHQQRRARFLLAAATGLVLAFTPALSTPPAFADPPYDHKVMVQLFQWGWDDVAKECEEVLGPKGFGGVQISPPQEHLVAAAEGYPWWQDYQPISYPREEDGYKLLKTRRGDVVDFTDMTERCERAGVKIYADTVINHMSGFPGGVGSAATSFPNKYTYPGTYSDNDFNDCREDIRDEDYQNDPWRVQHCELVGLADLRTADNGYVRPRIAQYLFDLMRLGVDGFRIDGAKHMPPGDIGAIKNLTQAKVDAYNAGRPPGERLPGVYFFQEVIAGAGQPITPEQYVGNGDVHETRSGDRISEKFLGESPGGVRQKIADLETFGQSWGLLSSEPAISMIDNHDSQRDALPPSGGGHGRKVLTHKNGHTYRLANVFLLGWNYGTPLLMSSFAFTQRDAGPPSESDGTTRRVSCGNGWVCEHRDTEIADMVGFRNAVGDAPVQRWWSNGDNQIAWARGDKGYVVINHQDGTLQRTFQTGLPPGRYCDVIGGNHRPGTGECDAGHVVEVRADGTFTASVPALSALAVHVGALVGGTEPGPADTAIFVHEDVGSGNRITLRGDHPPLSWSQGHDCQNRAADLWECTVPGIPTDARFEYKPLINDTRWSTGPNYVGTGGTRHDINPGF